MRKKSYKNRNLGQPILSIKKMIITVLQLNIFNLHVFTYFYLNYLTPFIVRKINTPTVRDNCKLL